MSRQSPDEKGIILTTPVQDWLRFYWILKRQIFYKVYQLSFNLTGWRVHIANTHAHSSMRKQSTKFKNPILIYHRKLREIHIIKTTNTVRESGLYHLAVSRAAASMSQWKRQDNRNHHWSTEVSSLTGSGKIFELHLRSQRKVEIFPSQQVVPRSRGHASCGEHESVKRQDNCNHHRSLEVSSLTGSGKIV